MRSFARALACTMHTDDERLLHGRDKECPAKQGKSWMSINRSAHHIRDRTPNTMNWFLCDALQQSTFEVLTHTLVQFDPQPHRTLLETDGGQLACLWAEGKYKG